MFRLTRKKDNVSAEIDFKVFVDNTEVGLLKNDSFLEFNFPNGEHEIEVWQGMLITCNKVINPDRCETLHSGQTHRL